MNALKKLLFTHARLVRFLVIGVMSLGLYFGLYALASRVLFPKGNLTFESWVANALSSIFNFWAHRRFTFESHGAPVAQLSKFILVAVSATLLHSALFWFLQGVLGIYDFVAATIVTGCIAFYTYFVHRVFTFRPPDTTVIPPLADELDQSVL